MSFSIEGDMDRLRVPMGPMGARPRMADRLWEHTCCEIFIARKGLPAYHELNFSPSGEWAAYAFERYRRRAPAGAGLPAAELDPRVAVRALAGQLELDTSIRLDCLFPRHIRAELALALAVVIEDGGGALSYWALSHPPGKPDFHHDSSFALDLPESRRCAG